MKLGFVFLALPLLATIVACGGGSNNHTEPTSPPPPITTENTAPTAEIIFPGPDTRTISSHLTVTGTANDASKITAVTVNGVTAQSNDSFTTWKALVPITSNSLDLIVGTEDEHGNSDNDAASHTIYGSYLFAGTGSSTFDNSTQRLYMTDSVAKTIVMLDTNTQHLKPWFGRNSGLPNPPNISFDHVAINEASQKLYAFSRAAHTLIEIDTDTREWRTVINGHNPSLPSLYNLDTFTLDQQDQVIYAMTDYALFTINISDGSYTSNNLSGAHASYYGGAVLDKSNNRLIRGGFVGFFGIDINTGVRSNINSIGPHFSNVYTVTNNPAQSTIFAVGSNNKLHRVNTSAGTHSVINLPNWEENQIIKTIAFNNTDNSILLWSQEQNPLDGAHQNSITRVYQLTLQNNTLSLLHETMPASPLGTRFSKTRGYDGVYFDKENSLQINVGPQGVLVNDWSDNSRRLLPTLREGVYNPTTSYDPQQKKIFGITSYNTEVYVYDINDGEKTTLFDIETQLTADLSSDFANGGYAYDEAILDAQRNRMIVIVDERLISISLDDGTVSSYIDPSALGATTYTVEGLTLSDKDDKLFFLHHADQAIKQASLANADNISTLTSFPWSSNTFNNQRGLLHFVESRNEIVVTASDGIYIVDVANKSNRLIANNNTGRTPWNALHSRAFSIGNRVYLQGEKTLFQLEPSSGDMVLVAQ